MKKRMGMFLLVCTMALLTQAFTCNTAATARDTIATSFGYLTWAQSNYLATCQANPTQTPCVLISKAIPVNNLAIDALEFYCSGAAPAGQQPFASGGPCQPVASGLAALNAALANQAPIIADLKALANAPAKVAPAVIPPGGATEEFIEKYRI
jgi:hypothetical protein